MIFGIGTDIAAVRRFANMHARYGKAAARRILTADEHACYAAHPDPARFLAKRFAAKEAFAKAVGTGIRHPVSLRAIAVSHNETGRPVYACAPELSAWLAANGIGHVHLSLSDEADYVVAFAVAERA